jgi:hypothetical protein
MIKRINFLFAVATTAILMSLSSCKFPNEKITDFKLNIDGSIVNPLIQIKINTEDSVAAEKLILYISGADAKWFYDLEGKTNFNAEGGSFYLVMHPDANPSQNIPYKITVNLNKQGYLPIKQDLFITSNTQRLTFTLTLRKLSNAPAGFITKSISLDFLGKKRTDTVFFNFTRPDGINFGFKMPTKGLVFVRSSNFKFLPPTSNRTLSEVLPDNSIYTLDLPSNPFKNILSIVNSQISGLSDPKESTSEIPIASGTYITNTLLGYLKSNLSPIEKPRFTFDTIPLTNVRVQMVSSPIARQFNFVDENGIFQTNLHIFEGGLVSIPELTFYDARTGTPITPYYPKGENGILTEIDLPENNYKMFVEGIGYSGVIDNPFLVRRVVSLNQNNFTPNDIGGYKLRIANNLLRSNLFFYKTSSLGCDSKILTIKAPKIPLNSGFSGSVEIKQGDFSLLAELLFNTPEIQVPVSSATGVTSQINGKINHSYQSCQSNGQLFDQNIDNVKICDDINLQRDIVIPYDGVSYLGSIPKLETIKATAKIQCSSGNFISPPAIDFKFRKLGCAQNSLIRIEGGQFYANSFIENNSAYVLQYDRISSAGKPTTVYDTLYFDPTIPNKLIVDEVKNYWYGFLSYTAQEGYVLDITLDNKKLKYKIPNCN